MERVTIREFLPEDSIPMYLLRCSDDVANVSLNEPPTKEQHQQYVERILSGAGPEMYVADVGGYYAGSCSINKDNYVNIMVAAPYRRTGVATALLRHVQSVHDQLVALVHRDNTASLALFTKCGFLVVPEGGLWKALVWVKEEHASAAPSHLAKDML